MTAMTVILMMKTALQTVSEEMASHRWAKIGIDETTDVEDKTTPRSVLRLLQQLIATGDSLNCTFKSL